MSIAEPSISVTVSGDRIPQDVQRLVAKAVANFLVDNGFKNTRVELNQPLSVFEQMMAPGGSGNGVFKDALARIGTTKIIVKQRSGGGGIVM